jgi:type I restriction enzyme S subunit
MAGEWQSGLIDDLVEEIIDRRGITPLKLGSDFTTSGYRVISAKAIKDRRVDLSADDPRFVDHITYRRWMKSPLRADDVILTSEAPLGEPAYVSSDHEWCLGQRLFGIRTTKDRLSGRFLFYALQSEQVRHDLLSRATGTTAQGIRQAELRRVRVPLPQIEEQRAIAHILGTLDDKIDLNQRMSETLEAIVGALFKSWFLDFDPVRATIKGHEPSLPKPLADLFPACLVDSELGEIPEGWEVALAGNVFGVAIGKTPPRKEHHWFSTDPQDVPWMSIKDLGQTGAFIAEVSEYLTPAAVERFRVRRIPDGTVVLSFKLTIGRVSITDGEMLSNEAIAHFLPRGETFLSSAYLYCYLRQFDYESLGSTSSIATAVNSDSVRAIPVLVPSEKVHEAFLRAVWPSFLRLRGLQRESRALAALRDALLPKLISGEVRVRDCEHVLAESGA